MTEAKPKERKTCGYCPMPGPRCEYHYCGKPSDWSVMVPAWQKTPPFLVPKFFCNPCLDYFKKAMAKPLKGIDRPADAPEDWRPSLMEHLRWARIEMEFQDRDKNRQPAPVSNELSLIWPDWKSRFTPAQLEQVKTHLALMHKYR